MAIGRSKERIGLVHSFLARDPRVEKCPRGTRSQTPDRVGTHETDHGGWLFLIFAHQAAHRGIECRARWIIYVPWAGIG